MSEVFLKVLNMSISATWLVAAVLAARCCLKKAPRWVHVLLWGIVAVRLLCPFSIESALSLIPSAEVVSPDIMMDRTPEITTGIPALNAAVNPIISQSFAPAPMASANPLQIWIPITAAFWIAGMAVMAIYTAVSYFLLRRRVSTATPLFDNIFQSARIPSPFVLGLFRPRIYLPFGMKDGDMAHVIVHERSHIRRRDHWWKPLGFLLLTVHWFNPFMWMAYILLCRDIELACDERVIRELDRDSRADYSQALLSCSVNRRMIAACPLAFGEVGVKERVKNVLNYKKPAFWGILLAVLLCCAVAVCFLTDPKPSREFAMDGSNVADLDAWEIVDTLADLEGLDDGFQLYTNTGNFGVHLTDDFQWDDSQTVRFFYFKDGQEHSAQLRIFPKDYEFFVTEADVVPIEDQIYLLLHYLQALQYLPQDDIREMCPDADGYIITQRAGGSPDAFDRVITYTMDGTQPIDGWLIHFELQPMHDNGDGLQGMGEEVIHLFYRDSAAEVDYGLKEWFTFGVPEVFNYPQNPETTSPAFHGVTFRCNGYEMKAEDGLGETVLFSGMPIWNACFLDVTGDGLPDLCATVSYGSGMVDTHVVVYDYANRQEYTLWDRGFFDYSLRVEDGKLLCDQKPYMDSTVLASGELILADAGGGSGRRLTIDSAAMKSNVVSIVDRTVTEQLPTDEAIEVFYEDDAYVYSFASIRSHLVVVTYSDGSTADIKTALETGMAQISDLDRFGIHYYAEPKVIQMEATPTNLRGLVAGYLFVPIDGQTYRYAMTEPNPDHVTADKLLDTCIEETPIEGIVWEVYSLKEYPDMTSLMIISGANSAWLCEYAPARQAAEGALQAVKEAGYVVEEDGLLTSGREAWEAFYEAAQKGTPGFIRLAHYFTLDPDRTASATYEAYKQDYPSLHVSELSYDGEVFVLRTQSKVRTYEYLMKYTASGTPLAASAEHQLIERYVLTHDNTHTWDQLWSSLLSSAVGVAIDHYAVCTIQS